jgi:hypothetical protein
VQVAEEVELGTAKEVRPGSGRQMEATQRSPVAV